MIAEELMADLVQEVRGDAGRDIPADLLQCLGAEAARDPHRGDRLVVLDVLLTERWGRLADILGTDDVRGNLPGGGKAARVKQGSHVLRF